MWRWVWVVKEDIVEEGYDDLGLCIECVGIFMLG